MKTVRSWIFRVVVCAGMVFGTGATAGSLDGKVVFRSTPAPESTLTFALGEWTSAERARVTALLERIRTQAPGMFARMTQAGPVNLYRTADDSPDHPAAAWARRRHENTIVVRDDFFRAGFPNHLGIEYSDWIFLHEAAHLADPVGEIGRSTAWRALVEPRIKTVTTRLEKDGLSLRDAMFRYMDQTAIEAGFPSIYATISIHEALSEYAAAYFFGAPVEIPDDVRTFLQENLFSYPSYREARNVRLYRSAYLAYRQKDYAAAGADMDAALKLSPQFALGYYLRGFVRMAAGDLAGADRDLANAQSLFEPGNLREQQRLRDARAYIAKQTGD